MSILSSCSNETHLSEEATTANVDVTPVMNMFIILIPFLVSMAVFTHFSMLDFSVPPDIGTHPDQSESKPTLRLTIVVAQDFLALTLGDRMLDSIPSTPSGYNFATLSSSLSRIRNNPDITNEVIVAARDRVRFQNIITTMDICREHGFSKIGISSATEDPQQGI